ncbi:MAG: ribosome maturation factor RimM [Terriglobia bacterium]
MTIGCIRRTHGRRGEVAVEILTDFPDRFQAGENLLLSNGSGVESQSVEASRFHKGRMIVKFAGIDSITAAETLVGRWIRVPGSARRVLPPRVFYISDLIGCVVREDGETLGTVEAIEETGGALLLQVRTAEGELLVPFAEEICRTIDVAKREIHVRLPEGLKDLATGLRTARRTRPARSRRRGNS